MAASTTKAAGTGPRMKPKQSEGQIVTEIKTSELIWRPKILLAVSMTATCVRSLEPISKRDLSVSDFNSYG